MNNKMTDKQKDPDSKKEKEETENFENPAPENQENQVKNQENKKSRKKQGLGKETMKNSGYNLTNKIISKVGGLVLTIILARMLLPELYGLYNLVLSIVLIAGAIINRGTKNTLVRYVSEQL